ncbi:putative outer membrane protein, probably involved in nutrient binding [Zunongwangia profunda SM-A87]|uniref:Outer membrane protein, probably involved in nutrient binding n=1 Tax=Zunongwangia profunda (strain DSM 18752 / CCTCC AB 206139 / SM-A87) TaxID=655815 RepID=D5BJV2_ZUNPS|nr:TonB-dependent receptor [Zunongwangia profunda]ADF53800.1 putative outer membrane protein, probably involved in nutrient binding [Zunongwangia profunda SM-A87]
MSYAQATAVTGTVKDEKGVPIPGATVSVKGKNQGTITDFDGNFSLSVSDENTTLVFSYVGFRPQEIMATSSPIHVTLLAEAESLNEVVITAFGAQKKINVTGAISEISGEQIVNNRVGNITNALVGSGAGITGLQTSGEPGRNSTNIRIRGLATYGNTTPLIVIDGVEQAVERAFDELNAIDPNEIESISVLKDAASTAVYGIRGANGVIIVTTKRGRVGKAKINFSANYGLTRATSVQEGVSSYEWALMRNEGIENEMNSYPSTDGLSAYIYNEDDLWKFMNNRDFTPEEVDAMANLTLEQKNALKNSPAVYYGNRDLYAEQFGDLAPQTQLNFNINGGTERVRYFVSLGYFSQKGITSATDYYGANTGSNFRRYNFRSNFDIDVVKNLKISLNLAGQFGQTQGPGTNADPYDLSGRYKVIMQYIYDGNPFMTPGIMNGHLISGYAGVPGTPQNPLALKTDSQIGNQNAVFNLLNSGTGSLYNTLLDNTVRVEHTMDYLLEGLKIHGTVNYQDNYNRYVTYVPSLPAYTVQRNPNDPNELDFFGGAIYNNTFNSYGYGNWNKIYVDAGINYNGSYKNHNYSMLFLGKASKYTLPNDSNNTPSGIMGLVGRVTYNYLEKYMLEFNLGYNGTEQFAEGERFGFFPAYSVGWVPSLEPFFPENDYLTFFKLRGSYGIVGNDLLAGTGRRYLYFPNTYNINQGGYWLGDSNGSSTNDYYPGVTEGTLGNPFVTWEKAKKYDLGIEARFFKDKLNFTYDYFEERRDNILTTIGTIPAVYGVPSSSVPPANIGITENKGFELSLKWDDRIGEVGYSIAGNVTYAKNKIVYRAEAPNPYPWMNQTGFSIGQKFGLTSDGFFDNQEELANRPYNTFTSNKATLGDIKYVDINGDGMIDNKDISPIGFPNNPLYHMNLRFSVDYKGFDLSALLVGSHNGSYYLNTGYTLPFYKRAGNVWEWMYEGRWTPEKVAAGEEITYPRATFDATSSDNNWLTSDFWLVSNDYVRLKNIEIGYTFSQGGFFERAKINSFRVYANGNNLFTFNNELSDKGIDPESPDGNTYIYPLTSLYTLGVNIQF